MKNKTKRCYIDSIDQKRLYFDAQVTNPCPQCGEPIVRDFSDDYLSYPQEGEEVDLGGYCETCDEHMEIPATIKSIVITFEFPAKE